MGYTTYEFYQESYYGDTITEPLFEKWNSRASDEIFAITFGRSGCIDNYDNDTQVALQKATCSVADFLFKVDTAENFVNTQTESNVKSKSSGGESVTYGSTETDVTKAMSDHKSRQVAIYNSASIYLSGTGLLYAGC